MMTTQEVLSIMQSDLALWDNASTEDLGEGTVRKVLELPWGIGNYEVTLEGLTNGVKRREALGQYGAHIRAVVADQINDDAIESRAKGAAQKAEQGHSGDSVLYTPPGVSNTQGTQAPKESPEGSHETDAEGSLTLGAMLIARGTEARDDLIKAIGQCDDTRRGLTVELKVVEAALAAMETPEDTEAAKVVERSDGYSM